MSAQTTSDKVLSRNSYYRGAPPQVNSDVWVRNPSWGTLPSVTGFEKFVGLHAVYSDANFVALNVTGDYTVDWGDGVVENVSAGVNAYHEYTFSDTDLDNTNAPVTFADSGDLVNRTAHGYSDGMQVSFYNLVSTTGVVEGQIYFVVNATANTFQVSDTAGGSALALTTDGSATLLPYKQAIVQVYPQGGHHLQTLDLDVRHNQSGLSGYSTNWLDISVEGAYLYDMNVTDTAPAVYQNMVERVSVTGDTPLQDCAYMFYSCSALRNVASMSVSTKAVSCACTTNVASGTFSCVAHGLVDGDYVTITALESTTGVGVGSYYYVVSSSADTFKLALTRGGSAIGIDGVDGTATTQTAVDMTGMFSYCYSLRSVPLFNTADVTSMSSMFQSCHSLQSVPLFNTVSVTSMSGMFQSCYSLQSVPLFNTASVTNMSGMFYNCYSLQSVPLFNTVSVTNMSYMFYYCRTLQSVSALVGTGGTSSASHSNMFIFCPSLSNIDVTGFKYTFSVANCKLSADRLNEIYTNLPTRTGQTITVTGNYGVTGDTPSIATAKGWTVTG